MSLTAVTATGGSSAPAGCGTGIRLTRKERELLAVLQRNPGRCITRQTLLRQVWGYRDGVKSRTVDVHVQRLRGKLGPAGRPIKTIVRSGYCWMPEPAGS